MDKILFVLPLDEKYVCPVHNGVLRAPVKNACGHYLCKECVPKASVCTHDGSPLDVQSEIDNELQEEINSLLCYCKYGVKANDAGELNADPKGCDHIINYGTRAEHEATCEHRESADFIMVENAPQTEGETPKDIPQPSVLIPCLNKEDGCFFLAASNPELEVHLNDCSYERLRRQLRQSESRVELLEKEIQLRDKEISMLRSKLEGASDAQKIFGTGKHLIEEFLRILEEEVPLHMAAFKDQVVSPALNRSSTAISSFKSNVIRRTEQVKHDLSELHPIDSLSEKLPSVDISGTKDRIVEKLPSVSDLSGMKDKLVEKLPTVDLSGAKEKINDGVEKLAELHPLDKLIAILSTLKNNVVSSMRDMNESVDAVNYDYDLHNTNNNNNSYSVNGVDIVDDPIAIMDDEDPEVKRMIMESLATFEEEQRNRREREENEAAAVAAAAALSLKKSQQ